MKNGDPERVPVLMADARSTAAAYFGVSPRVEGKSTSFTDLPESPVSPEMIRRCHRETGMQMVRSLGGASHLDATGFMADIEMAVHEATAPDGEIRRHTTIRTLAGEMTETFVTPPGQPAYWADHLVKSDADLPALTCLIEGTAQVSQSDPRLRQRLTDKFRAEAAQWPADTTFTVCLGVPTFVLACNLYMDHATFCYLHADHPDTMERLYEAYEQANAVWLECAAAAGADITFGAINGLELFSPEIYRRYFVPQARRLHEDAHARGMLGWVHTCGHMRRLIETGVYDDMAVDLVESLSSPPLGDLADLRAARTRLGCRLTTRGAVNVNFFYEPDLAALRRETRRVLDAMRGWRHLLGDTNDSFPPYPRENILTLVDEVRRSGRMLS
jgi:hypothetical protein